MRLRILSLSILAALAACNNSSDSPVSESTFASAAEPAQLPLTPDEVEAAAYAAVAPQDTVVKETTYYDTTINGSVALADVNETASAMRHSMTINGKTVRFTARAGHLVAYDATTEKTQPANRRRPPYSTPPILATICRGRSAR